jgi:hypothetical protein
MLFNNIVVIYHYWQCACRGRVGYQKCLLVHALAVLAVLGRLEFTFPDDHQPTPPTRI